ncbi:MAG: hypothetical protein M9942_00285 [Microthrixaceae bacterium]|nr:DUF1049 domain-containing protein [Microthrixaceae bacterium]MCO5316854.1 hypothetical protein [Microthrixaceae bacterium]
MGESDHLPGEPDEDHGGFHPSGKQVGGAIIAVVLLVFIAVNSTSTEVSLIFFSPTLPLWLVLAVTALLGFGVGMLVGGRRTKARMSRK